MPGQGRFGAGLARGVDSNMLVRKKNEDKKTEDGEPIHELPTTTSQEKVI
jgi:hypothetical protein